MMSLIHCWGMVDPIFLVRRFKLPRLASCSLLRSWLQSWDEISVKKIPRQMNRHQYLVVIVDMLDEGFKVYSLERFFGMRCSAK